MQLRRLLYNLPIVYINKVSLVAYPCYMELYMMWKQKVNASSPKRDPKSARSIVGQSAHETDNAGRCELRKGRRAETSPARMKYRSLGLYNSSVSDNAWLRKDPQSAGIKHACNYIWNVCHELSHSLFDIASRTT